VRAEGRRVERGCSRMRRRRRMDVVRRRESGLCCKCCAPSVVVGWLGVWGGGAGVVAVVGVVDGGVEVFEG